MTSHLEQIMELRWHVYTGLQAYYQLFGEFKGEQVEGFDRFLAEQVLIANAEYVLTALYNIIETDGYYLEHPDERPE